MYTKYFSGLVLRGEVVHNKVFQVSYLKIRFCAGGKADTQEEPVSPGPDGRLISTEERMEQVRKGPNESTITTTVVTKHVKQGKCL